MTLREKLKPIVSINTAGEAGRFADKIEIITDEFAIRFGEWIDSDFYQGDDVNEYHKSILEYREGKIFTVKELLEIYKKEKGL